MHLSLVYVLGPNGAALVIGANIGGKLPNRQALTIGVLALLVAALYIAVLIIQPHWLFVEIGFFAYVVINGHYFPCDFYFSDGK